MRSINSWGNVKRDLLLLKQSLKKDFSQYIDATSLNVIQEIVEKNFEEKGFWKYNVEKCNVSNVLKFSNIDKGRNVEDAILELKLTVRIESVIDEKLEKENIVDPIKDLNVLIVIEGLIDSIECLQVISSWHLDREVPKQKDPFIHPLYHWHFGGKKMKERLRESDYSSGNILLLSSPRIPHPPMDLILAIDFIIHNFYNKEQRENIVNNNDYRVSVRNAQERYWKPYSVGLTSRWVNKFTSGYNKEHKAICDTKKKVSYSYQDILPNIIV